MIDKAQLDFLVAWGEEFAGAIGFVEGLESVTPHDGQEVFVQVFKQEPTPTFLSRMTLGQAELLRAATERRLEHPVPLSRVREAIARTLVRWPAEG
jgi:hypothetical protein